MFFFRPNDGVYCLPSRHGRWPGPLSGLYHCDFNGIAGASTHFEPVYARYASRFSDENSWGGLIFGIFFSTSQTGTRWK